MPLILNCHKNRNDILYEIAENYENIFERLNFLRSNQYDLTNDDYLNMMIENKKQLNWTLKHQQFSPINMKLTLPPISFYLPLSVNNILYFLLICCLF